MNSDNDDFDLDHIFGNLLRDDYLTDSYVEKEPYSKKDIFRKKIDEAVEEFIDKNEIFDFEKKDIIIKKIDGKYKVIIDNKRKEKLKQIFNK
jgi:hypothetical protein